MQSYAQQIQAIILLSVLIYTHLLVSNYPAQCLDQVKENWPKKGIVRVEVIRNLEEFREMQARRESCKFHQQERISLLNSSFLQCPLNAFVISIWAKFCELGNYPENLFTTISIFRPKISNSSKGVALR
jgi:hypothetical protein